MASGTRKAAAKKQGAATEEISAYFQDGQSRQLRNGDANRAESDHLSPAVLKNIVKECLKDLEEKVGTISESVSTVIAEQRKLGQRMKDIETKYTELDKAMQYTDDEVEKLKSQNDERNQEIARLKAELKESYKRIEAVESASLNLQRYSHNYNLRIGGIPEQENEDCVEIVRKLATEKFKMADILIDNAHRTTSRNMSTDSDSNRGPPHIIVKFPLRTQRSVILSNWREALKDTDIFIKTDLCPADYKVKRSLRTVMNTAYKEKKTVRFVKGQLYINQQRYIPPRDI